MLMARADLPRSLSSEFPAAKAAPFSGRARLAPFWAEPPAHEVEAIEFLRPINARQGPDAAHRVGNKQLTLTEGPRSENGPLPG
jgi:hypothetical protein